MQDTLSFSRERPFNDLPPLPPKGHLETETILKKCLSAMRELHLLNMMASQFEDQRFLTRILPYVEATYSSEIENIVTTTDKIFSPSNNETDPATKEARRYGFTLNKYAMAISLGHSLDIGMIVEIANMLLEKDNPIRKGDGVRLTEPLTKKTIYTPPLGRELIESLLVNMLDFVNKDTQYDVLIKMALLHYQFEAIHPFADGNGRTGRILCILYLMSKGALSTPILYLSRYIIKNKRDYYGLIRAVTESGDWHDWICFMLSAIEETARWTRDIGGKILKLRSDAVLEAKKIQGRSYTEALVKLCFEKPYCGVENVLKRDILKSRQAALPALRQLADAGLFHEIRLHRKVIFRNQRLLEELASI